MVLGFRLILPIISHHGLHIQERIIWHLQIPGAPSLHMLHTTSIVNATMSIMILSSCILNFFARELAAFPWNQFHRVLPSILFASWNFLDYRRIYHRIRWAKLYHLMEYCFLLIRQAFLLHHTSSRRHFRANPQWMLHPLLTNALPIFVM